MPEKDLYLIDAVSKDIQGNIYHLRGAAHVETTDILLTADEIDWDADTGDVEARGHVHLEDFPRGEKLDCDRAEYNVDDETGQFYDVTGTAVSQVQARPGLLTTTNPYYFQSKWVERLQDHYILHDGFMTDCLVPHPWWVLKAPEFDVVPGDHAIARHSWFYLKKLPIFYTPYFYKNLKKEPRKSGFLVPNIGNSSQHGKMIGLGYYWAISRSFDLTYRALFYTSSGLASNADFRGKITDKSDFDLTVFGVNATQTNASTESGVRVVLNAKADLGDGWQARGILDYLSSFGFLQDFTQNYNEAVSSETHSVGFIGKRWGDIGVNFVAQRDENFESTTPGQTIVIQKLPDAEVFGRDHEIDFLNWPFWITFQASGALIDRNESAISVGAAGCSAPACVSYPALNTGPFVDRLDFAPHVTTAFKWHDFSLIPTIGIEETQYGKSLDDGSVVDRNLLRNSRDVQVQLILPSLERIFDAPPWLGKKMKHVIEERVTYKYVDGINNFSNITRFDELDLLTNTNQLEVAVINRLLTKDKNGTVTDFLTWELRYDRYFDPTFGGAVLPGVRNVIESSIDLTGFAFLAGPRSYSPVVSVVRIQQPKVGIEWRADYDPLYHEIVNSSVQVDGRIKKYFWSVGHTVAHTNPILMPSADQIHSRLGYGNPNSKGWNAGFDFNYDFKAGVVQFWDFQVTKNTDCCGFSVQYRRFTLGTKDDTQIQGAFAISNIGTFGSLQKQDRMF
jgi:LPS-assembly protein